MQPAIEHNEAAYLATAFRDVDADSDLGKVLTCLRFMEGLPAFGAYKRRSIEMMQLSSGASALDIGCGLGFDVARLRDVVGPSGRAVGVDSSDKLLGAARGAFGEPAGIEWCLGDAEHLEFSDSSLDGVRVDRTLQHLAHPQAVIGEMRRVLRPNRWAVCAEPDWGTFVIDADSTVITEQIVKRWRDGFRNPWIGRQLLRRLRSAGFQNTWVEGFILVADGLDAINTVYDIQQTMRQLSRTGESSVELDGWYDGLVSRDGEAGVTASVTLFLAGGQKAPGGGADEQDFRMAPDGQ